MALSRRMATTLIVGGIVIAAVAALAFKDRADRAERRVAELEHQAAQEQASVNKPQARPTFDLTVQALIDRFNGIQAKIDRAMLLPPEGAMEDGGTNASFHTLRHQVHPGVYVMIEVDNVKKRPFSIGVTAMGGDDDYAVRLTATLAVIGATVFDPQTGGGDVLLKGCAAAGKASDGQWGDKVGGFDVFCGTGGGLWMAGISTPKEI